MNLFIQRIFKPIFLIPGYIQGYLVHLLNLVTVLVMLRNIRNSEKADEIRKNANAYISQFKNKRHEDVISVLVLKKYFENTK